MKIKFPVSKITVATATLLIGISANTRADDSSNSRFGGDSYASFHEGKPVINSTRLALRQNDSHGLSESEYQTRSSEGPAWQPKPVIDKTVASFRQTSPRGLSFGEYQALSSK